MTMTHGSFVFEHARDTEILYPHRLDSAAKPARRLESPVPPDVCDTSVDSLQPERVAPPVVRFDADTLVTPPISSPPSLSLLLLLQPQTQA